MAAPPVPALRPGIGRRSFCRGCRDDLPGSARPACAAADPCPGRTRARSLRRCDRPWPACPLSRCVGLSNTRWIACWRAAKFERRSGVCPGSGRPARRCGMPDGWPNAARLPGARSHCILAPGAKRGFNQAVEICAPLSTRTGSGPLRVPTCRRRRNTPAQTRL